MKHVNLRIVFLCVIVHLRLVFANIARPENFYGSEALLDGYCDEAQYFIDVFTLSSEQRLTVEGSAGDVAQELATVNTTGQFLVDILVND